MALNLCSVQKLMDSGVSVLFHPNQVVIQEGDFLMARPSYDPAIRLYMLRSMQEPDQEKPDRLTFITEAMALAAVAAPKDMTERTPTPK
ncbi:hypothetical protein TWF481_002994 [Arthrobotrys musiformis]|uniref:Uncharacterized protein n=1 Tax=Arthrobotrys musiformis TaxID=47236 RepID=A0AAV9VTW6_9PEZI